MGGTLLARSLFCEEMPTVSARTAADSGANFNAELYAVLVLLLKWPRRRSLHIISDNTALIKVVETAREWSIKEWRKIEYAPILRQIIKIIAERDRAAAVVTRWSHAYSHLDQRDCSKENIRKLNIMEERYGEYVRRVIRGNARADQLASAGTAIPQTLNFWQWMDTTPFVLMKTDGSDDVINAPRKALKEICRQLDIEEFQRTKRHCAVPDRFDQLVDYDAATRLFTQREPAYSPLMGWCVKLQAGKLTVRAPPPWSSRQQAADAIRSCPFAGSECPADAEETIEHMLECRGTIDIRRSLPDVILEIVNRWRACKPRAEMNDEPFFRWWIHVLRKPIDPLCGQALTRLKYFPRFWESAIPTQDDIDRATHLKTLPLLQQKNEYFARGHVPLALTEALLQVGVRQTVVRAAVDQIQVAIVWTMSRCWYQRCRHVWEKRRQQEKEEREREEAERRQNRYMHVQTEEFERLCRIARANAERDGTHRDQSSAPPMPPLAPDRNEQPQQPHYVDPQSDERAHQIRRQLRAPMPRIVPRWDAATQIVDPDLAQRRM
jgi:hypothetical protein